MRTMTLRRRSVMIFLASVALLCVLVLAACGGRGGQNTPVGNTGNSTTSTTTQSNGGSNANTNDLSSADQQIQSAVTGMDNASNDASANPTDTTSVP